jgi:NADPH2:quinone reductase
MRTVAARLKEHSQPLQVEDVELAEPAEGDVVVQMAFAGLNPVDRYQAEGRVAPDARLPRTLGSEGSGWVGDRPVMVRGHGLGSKRDGLWARAAVVPEQALISIPDGVALEQAAVMGVAGVTAWRCATEKARLGPDDRVLVMGASGGVGSMLVSLARSAGATVWGQTGDAGKVAWIRARGAAEVVVGGADQVVESASDLRPTVVFDPLGDGFFAAALKILQDKGRLVTFGTSADAEGVVPLQLLYRKALTVNGYGGLIESDEALAEGVRQALAAVRDGRMEVVVDRVVPLEEVNSGFALLADRSVHGKIVLGLQSAGAGAWTRSDGYGGREI